MRRTAAGTVAQDRGFTLCLPDDPLVVESPAELDRLAPRSQRCLLLDGTLDGTTDPAGVLAAAARAVVPDGRLVLVAGSARNLGLLGEIVEHGAVGPPLRRYTRRELLEAVDGAGLDVAWVEAVRDQGLRWIPLPVTEPARIDTGAVVLPGAGAEVVEESTAAGFALVARPRPPAPPACSIVVTWGGEAGLLVACLAALDADPPEVDHEVVVVDDGPVGSPLPVPLPVDARVVPGPRQGYAAAANAGIRAATGDVVALLHDDTVPRPGWLDRLHAHVRARPAAGPMGPKLVYPGRGTSCGAGLALSLDLLPYPLYRHHPAGAPEIERFQEVVAVPGACLVVRRRYLVEAGGFDEGLRHFADGDLCLRLAARGHPSTYCPDAVVEHLEGGTPGPRELPEAVPYFLAKWQGRLQVDDEARCAADGVDVMLLRARSWHLPRRGRTPVDGDTPPVLWTGLLFDRSGYANEARSFLWSLRASGVPTFGNPYRWPPPRVELPPDRAALLDHMVTAELPGRFVHVAHLPALSLQVHPGAVANVARTMWETDHFPAGRVQRCLPFDEVWVPSQSNVDTLAESGIPRERLVIVPAPIDDALYRDPGPRTAIEGAEGFVFLSVFAWSRRKGWDLLIRGYVEEFAPHEDVTLVLAISSTLRTDLDDARRQVEELVSRRLGRTLSGCPRIVWLPLLNRPASEMVALYRGADAFVMPSRGEGAALPIMEAMASGLPAITTRGIVGYVNDDNAFLLDREMVEIDQTGWHEFGAFRGQRWAEASVPQLRDAMRRVIDDPDEAARRSERGRRDVLDGLSLRAVGDLMLERLAALARAQPVTSSAARCDRG